MALSREILWKILRKIRCRRRSWKKRVQKQRRVLEKMEDMAAEMKEEEKSMKNSLNRDVEELRELEASVERMSEEKRVLGEGAVRREACSAIMAALLYAHDVGDEVAADHLRRALRELMA